MSRLLPALALSMTALLSACSDEGGAGPAGEPGLSTFVASSVLPVGDATCPYGGIQVETGFDLDGDGVLDSSEIIDTEQVCNGGAGADGVIALVDITVVDAGGMCGAETGQKIDAGLDDDADGVLDVAEIERTGYVCNGIAGIDGADGIDAYQTLVEVTAEAANGTCPTGGTRIEFGLDLDRDDAFDMPGELVKSTRLCNGAEGSAGLDALTRVTSEAPGGNCATGGQRLESGLDDDRDGVLDAPAEVDATNYICNGAAGSPGLNALVNVSDIAAGATCAAGGKKIESGIDDNRDGTLDAAEVDATNNVCNGATGSDGYTSLLKVTDEPAGANCAAGGSRVDAGLDDNRDGTLDAAEIDSTSYVCRTVFPTLTSLESHPELCLHGASVLKSGLDLDLDATLDPEEVSASSTICQNNAAPSARMQPTEDPYDVIPDDVPLSSWFGEPVEYDAVSRTWSVSLYNTGAQFAFTYEDPNGDPLSVDIGPSPVVNVFDFDAVVQALFGIEGFGITVAAGAPGGFYDIPITLDDSEAVKGYTLRLDLRAVDWHFAPLPAYEGVDAWATGTVTFPQPLLYAMTLTGAGPLGNAPPGFDEEACLQLGECDGILPSALEVCVAGEPCVPASAQVPQAYCWWSDWLGTEVCIDTYPATQFQLPAGTTSFTVRRPIGDDGVWGGFNSLRETMNLRSGAFVFPALDARFAVVDNDAPPTVSFVDAVLDATSGGGSLLVAFTSTQADVYIPLLLSGTAQSGEHYTATADWVLVGNDGTGQVSIELPLNESMTGDVLLQLDFDALFGMTIGATPTTTVTIHAPPPLAAGFAAATASLSRYAESGCVQVQLNRLSYIQDVSFRVDAFDGTAVAGVDYTLLLDPENPVLTIPAGQGAADVCLGFTTDETPDDRTLVLAITNLQGAAAGTYLAQEITVAGGTLPSVDFAADTNEDLLDTTSWQGCAAVDLAGISGSFTVDADVLATPSDARLASYLQHSGFEDLGDGTWRGSVQLHATDTRTVNLCLSRPWEDLLPVGDFTVGLEIVDVVKGHVGTTRPTMTFHVSGTLPTVDFVDAMLEIVTGQSGVIALQSDIPYSTVWLSFGGSAWSGWDYEAQSWVQFDENGDASLTITTRYDEYLWDALTIEIGIGSGAVAGDPSSATVYITRLPPPDLDFTAASYDAMLDPAVHQDCIYVARTTPVSGDTNFTLHATLSDPGLAGMLTHWGYVDIGGGVYEKSYDMPKYGVDALDICFDRPLWATAAMGNQAISFEIAGAEYGQAGTTQPTTTLNYYQDYGTRDLSAAIEGGIAGSGHAEMAADGSVTRIGTIENGAVLVGATSAGSDDAYLVHLNPDGTRWQVQFGTANRDIVHESAVDSAGNIVVLVNEYSVGWSYVGSRLYRYGNDGVQDWSRAVPAGALLAHEGGVTLATDTLAGDFSALDDTGATLWTLAAADFGVTGCSMPPQFGAIAIAGTDDWYVAVFADASTGCAIPDVDGDAVTYPMLLARVSASGVIAWRVDDWAEAGGVALLSPDNDAGQDAAGNLYLALSEGAVHQVMKLTPAGSVPWVASRPACAGCSADALVDISVSPAGFVATSWSLDGDYGAETNAGYGADIVAWTLDATGATVFDAVLGTPPGDTTAWLIARDDQSLLMQMTEDGFQGVYRLDGIVESQLEQGIYDNSQALGLADGTVMLIQSNQAVQKRDAGFNML